RLRRSATHRTPGPMTSRSEGLLHRALRTDKNPRRATHVTGNNDRLPNGAECLRHFRMASWERACRALAMDPHLFLLAINSVFFEFRDVVSHVVKLFHTEVFPISPEHTGKHFTGLLHEQLPVAETVVGRSAHLGDVLSPFGRIHRRARELPVG